MPPDLPAAEEDAPWRRAPHAYLQVALAPASDAARETLNAAVTALVQDEASLGAFLDRESGQIMLEGADGTQIDLAVGRLIQIAEAPFQAGALEVAYREMLGRTVQVDHAHKRFFSAMGEFARVVLAFEPRGDIDGIRFENAASEDAVPADYLDGVERGIRLASEEGLLAGFPVVGFTARLVDGAYHDIDSSPRAFSLAAQAAFKALAKQGAPVIAEPIMAIRVTAPEAAARDVATDLSGRRAEQVRVTAEGEMAAITALIPAVNTLGYGGVLRRLTGGAGRHELTFDHRRPLPRPIDDDPRFPPAAAMRA